jgi:hypothetical protein
MPSSRIQLHLRTDPIQSRWSWVYSQPLRSFGVSSRVALTLPWPCVAMELASAIASIRYFSSRNVKPLFDGLPYHLSSLVTFDLSTFRAWQVSYSLISLIQAFAQIRQNLNCSTFQSWRAATSFTRARSRSFRSTRSIMSSYAAALFTQLKRLDHRKKVRGVRGAALLTQ